MDQEPSPARPLLIAAHASGRTSQVLIDEVAAAARAVGHIEVRLLDPLTVTSADVLGAGAVLLITPEHFGYMSGALKVLFDRTYRDCIDETRGLPYGIVVRAGNDGTGAVASIERIVAGLAWRAVMPAVIARGDELAEADVDKAREMAATLAAGLDAGLW